jgi:hypothetical protein
MDPRRGGVTSKLRLKHKANTRHTINRVLPHRADQRDLHHALWTYLHEYLHRPRCNCLYQTEWQLTQVYLHLYRREFV